MATRIYQATALTAHQTIALDEKASHHLARVLRADVNDPLILFNGDGYEYAALITNINKKIVTVKISTATQHDIESPIAIHLAQGIARGEKMDFIIQKAVELGVTHIFPLITERGNVRLTGEREEKRIQHWQSIIVSACEQSGRNKLPEINTPLSYDAWIKKCNADLRFVLSPHVSNKLAINTNQPSSIALVIGPEGGLSDSEISLATHHGFAPLNLGPRVLRTETATIAALSVLQREFGDFH